MQNRKKTNSQGNSNGRKAARSNEGSARRTKNKKKDDNLAGVILLKWFEKGTQLLVVVPQPTHYSRLSKAKTTNNGFTTNGELNC